MGKAKKAAETVVMTAPRLPGPLAAWRLPLSVAAAAGLTGMGLMDAMTTGQHLDLALGRSFGTAFVVWIATGRVNHILVDVEMKRRLTSTDGEHSMEVGGAAGVPVEASADDHPLHH